MVVGGRAGFDVDGAMKVSVLVVDPATVVEGDTDVDTEVGAAEGEPVPVLLAPQLTTPIARRTVATTMMTLRTGTSGGARQYQMESVGLRAANRNPSGGWTYRGADLIPYGGRISFDGVREAGK